MNNEAVVILMLLVTFHGAISCFFGYKVFKILLGATGFLLGGILGSMLAGAYFGEVMSLVGALVGALIGAALLVWLFYLGVFLVGAWLGALLGMGLAVLTPIRLDPVVLLAPALLCGVLALFLQRPLIILATSFGGAYNALFGLNYFLFFSKYQHWAAPIEPERFLSHSFRAQLAVLLLGLAGAIIQFKFTAGRPPVGEERKIFTK